MTRKLSNIVGSPTAPAEGRLSTNRILDPSDSTVTRNPTECFSGSELYTYSAVQYFDDSNGILAPQYQQYIRSEVIDGLKLHAGSTALDEQGYLWTWGLNSSGQNGNLSTANTSSPVSVVGGIKFASVVATTDTSSRFGLDVEGTIWSMGSNSNGLLGDGTTANKSSPVSVLGLGKQAVGIASIASNGFALDYKGGAWSWGLNTSGELGNNAAGNASSPVAVVGGKTFVYIAGCAGIDVDNNVWSWGPGTNGQLGDGSATNRSSPVLTLISNVKQMSRTTNTAYFLKDDGTVYSCGFNSQGQLGDGTTVNRSSPVSIITHKKFKAIKAHNTGAIGLDTDGQIWGWGGNNTGELGDGTDQNRSSPVSLFSNRRFVSIGGDSTNLVALDTQGWLWSWGSNTTGLVGDGTNITRSSPVIVDSIRKWKFRKV